MCLVWHRRRRCLITSWRKTCRKWLDTRKRAPTTHFPKLDSNDLKPSSRYDLTQITWNATKTHFNKNRTQNSRKHRLTPLMTYNEKKWHWFDIKRKIRRVLQNRPSTDRNDSRLEADAINQSQNPKIESKWLENRLGTVDSKDNEK